MGILSDDIMEIEEATANWTVRAYNKKFLRIKLRKDIPFPERIIKVHLDAIPIIKLTDEQIIDACNTVIYPQDHQYFTLKFDEVHRVWIYLYKPTKYSEPVGFLLQPV